MNKLLTKIASLFFGMGLAIGVGAAIGNQRPLAARAEEVTMTLSTGTFADGAITWADDNISILQEKNTGSTAPNSSYISAPRWYSGNLVTFTPKNVTIDSVVVTANSSSYATALKNSTWTNATATASGNDVTILPTDGTSVFTAVLGGQCRLSAIKYNFTGGSAPTITSFDVVPDGTELVNVDAAGADSASTEILYEITYSDSSKGYAVTITSEPAAGVSIEDDKEGTATITFVSNGDYAVTVRADSNNSTTINYKVAGIPSTDYELFTGEIVEGDYVIMSDDEGYTYSLGNAVSSDRIVNGAEATVKDGVISNPDSSIVWHVAPSGDYWTLQNAENNKYLAGGTAKNKAALADSDSNNFTKWNFAYSADKWVVDNLGRSQGSEPGNKYLKNNAGSGWAAYSASYGSSPALFRKASLEPELRLDKTAVTVLTDNTDGVTVKATVKNVESPTYSWVASNTNVILTGANTDTVTIKPNIEIDGSATVNLTVGGTTPALEASVAVTIKETRGTTPEKAYTVVQAKEAIDSGVGVENVYAKGIVSRVTYFGNGRITYWFSDDGTTDNELEVYNGLGLNGEEFESIEDVQVADEVIVLGNLIKYNSTYEFAANSVLYSQERDTSLQSVTLTNVENHAKSIVRGQTFQLEWALTPLHPEEGEEVEFTVSNASEGSEISVSEEGLISAGQMPNATARITISSVGNPEKTDYVDVTVIMDEMFITIDSSVMVYTKVTDASKLEDGDTIIITNNNATKGMKAYESGNNCSEADIVADANKETIVTVGDAAPLTLSDAGGGTFYIYDGANYLYAASTSANHLKGKAETDATNGAWTFEYKSSNMSIVAKSSSNKNVMQYNSGSSIFSCYASASQGALQVYKLEQGKEKIAVGADLLTAVLNFNKTFKCDASGESFDVANWGDASAEITATMKTTYKLADAIADKDGNLVEQFLARYDYVVGKYGPNGLKVEGVEDFLERDPAPVPSSSYMPLGSNAKSNAAATVIIIIAVLGVTAFGVYFLLRKRKEER